MTDFSNGWLGGVKHCYSPNFDARPTDAQVELLVIHNISLPPDTYSAVTVESFFCNCLDPRRHSYFETIAELRVSAHFLIDRFGTVTQLVSTESRAWHAGLSEYQGRNRCNDFSIGVELLGSDSVPYTLAQYQALADLSVRLFAAYPLLNTDQIVGHADIAPSRKTDPGEAFEWAYYRKMLQQRRSA